MTRTNPTSGKFGNHSCRLNLTNLLQQPVIHFVRYIIWFKGQFIIRVFVRSSAAPLVLVIVVLISLYVLRWDDGVVCYVVLVDLSKLLFLLQITSVQTIIWIHVGLVE